MLIFKMVGMRRHKSLNCHIPYTINTNNYFMHLPLTTCRYHTALISKMIGMHQHEPFNCLISYMINTNNYFIHSLSQRVNTTRHRMNTKRLQSSHIARGWLIYISNAYIPYTINTNNYFMHHPLTCRYHTTMHEYHTIM